MKKILVLILSSFLISGCNRLESHQPLGETKLFYKGVDSISESFQAANNNLNIVSICIRNPDRLLTPFTFTLHEATLSATPIRTVSFTGGNIDNQDCTRFQFEPVTDSKGKSYVASLTPTQPNLVFPRGNIYVEAHAGNDYLQGESYLDFSPSPHDLHFKTNYYQPLKAVLRESLTQFIARVWQDPIFFLFYLVLLTTTTYLLLRRK